MTIQLRKYNISTDFKAVGDFLIENYQPGNRDGNFLQPAWEYMCAHPMTDVKIFNNIGVWEDGDEIVGVVHAEMHSGEAFFDINPVYIHLKQEMLEYAEKHLFGKAPNGRKCMLAFINDFDKEFEVLAISRGYKKDDKFTRSMSELKIPNHFPPISLPAGFTLKSLAEDNDLAQITRVFWRGFNHGDEPPSSDLEGRKMMQSAPSFRKDLNIIAVAPDGNFVAYAGLWFESINKYAYVEPVCTDPDYRLRGLGKAAVMEGIRRCEELGAEVAYVGSVYPIYQSIGFKKLFTCNCWIKYLD
jgi:predicted N-acetyltransferase YhbS